ncbi:MAG: penicillin-binding protein 1A [Maricaulaceae bacterium]
MFAGAVIGLIGLGVVALYVVKVTRDLPSIAQLAEYRPKVSSRMHAGDGALIAEFARERRVFAPIEAVPERVQDAFLAAEDNGFYDHWGIDLRGMARGGFLSVMDQVFGDGGPLQSGSTITQQVAKNFLLSNDQTIDRKIKEIALAFRIEQALEKDAILELYLNEIWMGRRAFGVVAAALNYFDKSLDELTVAEAAYLAALPKGPDNYHPERRKPNAIGRRNWVIGRMADTGRITPDVAESARQDDLIVARRFSGETFQASAYFTEEVRRRVREEYGEAELYEGGLSIRTTLDTRLQTLARRALRDGLEAYDRRRGYRGAPGELAVSEEWRTALNAWNAAPDLDDWRPALVLTKTAEAAELGLPDGSKTALTIEDIPFARAARALEGLKAGDVVYVGPDAETGRWGLRQIPAVQGAFMAMDPFTGRVLAMVGGYSFRQSQFNRVTQARRQPGSAFKPYVYATALEAGYTPVSRVLDAPFAAPIGDGQGFYRPSNYSPRYYGLSTLRLGLEKSRNVMTVRLLQDLTLEPVTDYARRFGIYDDLQPYLSMGLGAGETTLWRLVGGYGALGNGGKAVEPRVLDRVQDRDGRTIQRPELRGCRGCTEIEIDEETGLPVEPELIDTAVQAVAPVTAYQIVSMLEGAVRRGTGTRARDGDRPLGGKTGTTNEFRDGWFVGFSPDLVAGVYVGFDEPRSLGSGEAGGRVAAPIFGQFMRDALEGKFKAPFRLPADARLVWVNPRSGALARPNAPGAILEAFRPGTEPRRDLETGDGIRVAGPFEGALALEEALEDDEEAAEALRGLY